MDKVPSPKLLSDSEVPPDRRQASGQAQAARVRREDGFTVFEALIASVVMVIGLVALLGMLDATVKASFQTRAREGAVNLARQVLESARTVAYAQMSPTSIEAELQERPGLADASTASGWQVIQRGITYTVTVSECAIDDPKDGYGKHETNGVNPFCPESSTEGTADTQPEDLKKITVDVTWQAAGRKPDVHQVETLTSAGSTPGLAASGLHLESPVVPEKEMTQPTISVEPASKTLTFAVTAPSSTDSMRWSLEGVEQSNAPTKSSGTTWTFSWSIPAESVSDGTYTVSVQAVDATGVVGPPVSIPVTLIRNVPVAPKNIKGGFNTINVSGTATKVVELEWTANSERNIIGYRVHDPSETLTCPGAEGELSVALSCIDGVGSVSPPEPAAANLTFHVNALYRNAEGKVKEGSTGSLKIEGGPPPAPNAPTSLSATKNEDGSVTLKWTLPSGGPAVKFFRIYRGSMDYTSRYGVSESGSSTSFKDESATGVHQYWITAVSANLTESAFLGPVSA